MTFNKTTTYAIMLLTHMANCQNMRCSATFLSKELNIPLQYCRQILTKLSKKELIKSNHGRNGGFIFTKPAAEIYLSEIIDAVEGMESFERCIMGFANCPFEKDNHCVMHVHWEGTRKKFIKILNTTSLDQFMKDIPA